MNRPLKIVLVVAAILAVGIMMIKHLYFGVYDGEDIRVNIPQGCADVQAQLRSTLGDNFGSKVARLWSLQGGNAVVSHGSYLVKDGESSLSVSRRIAKGRQTPVRFTFNNIRTVNDLAAKVAAVLEVDSAMFISVADTLLMSKGFSRDEEAAAFIPDTYEFYWTVSPEKLISKLYDARESFWTKARQDKAAAIGLTPNEVHTLASIVEGETNKNEEKGTIARLYLNRLKRDMPLQACPTVKFAMKKFDLRRITSAEINYQSPFNTYINKGLPPGPIAIAEKSTLDQVLDAPENDYIYMCAKSDFSGFHDFASTYDRHRINAARYHRALDQRGIKN